MRFILGKDYSERERLSKLNLLPLQYRREINDRVFFFKCYMDMCNLNIMEYVSFRTCIKPLRNVDHLSLDVPFSWTETFKNSFFIFFYLSKSGTRPSCQFFVGISFPFMMICLTHMKYRWWFIELGYRSLQSRRQNS